MFVQALAANQWVSIAILAVFFVLMIVMTIIPQRKRKKEYQDLMSNLSVGDKVMTIGRLIGKIYAIDDDSKQVTLNVGTDESETLIHKTPIATVIDTKNKPKTEEKPKKPNLGINKKHHDESVDDTSATESTNDITLGNTEDVSIDSKEDVKIDNDEDIKF